MASSSIVYGNEIVCKHKLMYQTIAEVNRLCLIDGRTNFFKQISKYRACKTEPNYLLFFPENLREVNKNIVTLLKINYDILFPNILQHLLGIALNLGPIQYQ